MKKLFTEDSADYFPGATAGVYPGGATAARFQVRRSRTCLIFDTRAVVIVSGNEPLHA